MRIKLIVAYDGTNYSGFAKNRDVVTIEGELNRALSDLTKENIEVIGASRTDAGVHALGNVAVFDTNCNIPPDRFRVALNTKLPEDIRIIKSETVSDSFHPRYTNVQKTYEYSIYTGDVMLPAKRLYSWHIYKKLDIEKMIEASDYIIGKHDFTSFCGVNGNQVKDKVRTVKKIDIINAENEIIIRVLGDGFLYNMVRIITGTLVDVGLCKIKPYEIKNILDAKDRRLAGRTAKASGLCLVKIEY